MATTVEPTTQASDKLPAASTDATEYGGSDKRNLLLLTLACLVLFFGALWTWGFIDPGDGYFSEASREMMERGDFIVPHLNYQIYFSKPILIYWLIISAYKTFGINEFAARFWSAALAMLNTGVIYWTVRSVINKRTALWAALIFATSPLVVTFARMSLIDMSFSALLGIALCATAMTLLTASKRWWIAIYVCLGLAVLDKGPAALVLYAIGLAGYFLVTTRSIAQAKATLSRLQVGWGTLITAAISLPWYIAVGLQTDWLFPKVFLLYENLARFEGHTNHKAPYFWFYLPVIAYGFFPWIFLLPDAIKESFAALLTVRKNGGKDAAEAVQQSHGQGQSALATLLFASWTFSVLLFFSVSQTKLQTYVLPAFPGMATLTAIALNSVLTRKESTAQQSLLQKLWPLVAVMGSAFVVAGAALATLSAAPDLILHIHKSWAAIARNELIDQSAATKVLSAIAALATGALLANAGLKFKTGATECGITRMIAAAFVGCAIFGPIAFQLGYKYKNADVHRAIQVLKDKQGPVAMYHDFKPSVVYHLQRPVDTFFSVNDLHQRTMQDTTQPQYVIADAKGTMALRSTFGSKLQEISRSGNWSVFETRELIAVRLPTLEQTHKQHIDLSGQGYGWGMLPFAGGSKP